MRTPRRPIPLSSSSSTKISNRRLILYTLIITLSIGIYLLHRNSTNVIDPNNNNNEQNMIIIQQPRTISSLTHDTINIFNPLDKFDQYWFLNQEQLFSPDEWKRFQKIRTSTLKFVERQKQSESNGFKNENRFITFTPAAQLANRLRSTISTIILAILLDAPVRVLFSYYASFPDLFESRFTIENAGVNSKDLKYQEETTIRVQDLPCVDFTRLYGSIEMKHGQYQVQMFLKNPYLAQQMEQLFGIRKPSDLEGLYFAIFSTLFIPVAQVRDEVIKFKQEHEFEHRYVIGLHIRGGGDHRAPFSDANWERFKTCSTDVKLGADKPVLYFVAADHQLARDRAQEIFGTENVRFYGTFQISNTPDGVRQALVELLLLSSCNGFVLSPYSSYSEFASSISRRRGFYAINDPGTHPFPYAKSIPSHNGDCLLANSMEPSFYQFDEFVENESCMAGKKIFGASSLFSGW
jgi:hypothetical protein